TPLCTSTSSSSSCHFLYTTLFRSRHALVKTWCCSLVSATAIVQAEVIFTDALQAVSIGACHCSVDQFIHYLRVSSWIERVRQVLRRDSARRFRYSVPIAVVDNSDRSSGEHTVLEVVGGGDSCCRSCITVDVECVNDV